MESQQQLNYHRIAEAIGYIQSHFREQPDLETIAAQVHLTPFHFQRLFTEWAGTSPKKFLQYISLAYARNLLRNDKGTLFEAALETGLSSTSRLHDLFVSMEGMTPAEYRNGGQDLIIKYSFEASRFGNLLLASTHKGVCYMAFYEEPQLALELLSGHYPSATFVQESDAYQKSALNFFRNDDPHPEKVKLHLKGTPFQLKVWEALLKIPMGQLSTYGTLARQIEKPDASRAVGTAIGSNPVAYLIPCHRVIQSTGVFGGYMWGPVRKTAIIGWELAQADQREGALTVPG
jgi:AraC family transcriptional regulator of adaptative response/methylated-DNA-[protein]-cysteine methyltransferase